MQSPTPPPPPPIKVFVLVSLSHEGWWKNFHPVSDRVIIMPPMLWFLCCWCLPFNRDVYPQFVFSLCTVQAVFSETRFGQIWCHRNVSKMLGFSSPQFRGQLLWSLSCLVSPPVTYEHSAVNNCMRKWDFLLFPFTLHCLVSPPVTYEHSAVNNCMRKWDFLLFPFTLHCLVSPPVTYEHSAVNNCMRKWDFFLFPFTLHCLVSPVTYEHSAVNNCMRKWDFFLFPFTLHCLVSPPVTYEHSAVNNRRSSEIQGTALGKCLWSWSCI